MATVRPDLDDASRRRLLVGGACGACALCLARFGFSATEAPPAAFDLGLVRPRPGLWFDEKESGDVVCGLCPWNCQLKPGQTGRCRVRRNHDGVGETLVHGNPVLVQEDPVERLPFFHVMPGSRTLSVSTAGCNIHCKFCEVWDMALVEPSEIHAYDMPPDRIIDQARAAGLNSVSYAFGEPVVFYEYMLDTASQASASGLRNLLHTAAFIEPAPLAELARHIDAVNVDLKGLCEKFYSEVCGGKLKPVLDALVQLREAGLHLEITNILLPGLNDEPDMVRELCHWVRDHLGPDTPLHFARFYPLYQLSNLPSTPASVVERARNIGLDSGLHHVYVARMTGHEGENTFCPNCGNKVIERTGFIVDRVDMTDGRCNQCDHPIAGLWN